MGYEGEIGSISRFEEESHAGYKAKHRGVVVGIGESDCDEECAGDEGEEVEPDFLSPDALGFTVEDVREDAA